MNELISIHTIKTVYVHRNIFGRPDQYSNQTKIFISHRENSYEPAHNLLILNIYVNVGNIYIARVQSPFCYINAQNESYSYFHTLTYFVRWERRKAKFSTQGVQKEYMYIIGMPAENTHKKQQYCDWLFDMVDRMLCKKSWIINLGDTGAMVKRNLKPITDRSLTIIS